MMIMKIMTNTLTVHINLFFYNYISIYNYMSWIVYLLVSRSIDFYNHTYVGITKDLNRRVNQHNGIITGGAKSTRAKRPYAIANYIENVANRSIASQMEFLIKAQKGYENRFRYMEELKKIEK